MPWFRASPSGNSFHINSQATQRRDHCFFCMRSSKGKEGFQQSQQKLPKPFRTAAFTKQTSSSTCRPEALHSKKEGFGKLITLPLYSHLSLCVVTIFIGPGYSVCFIEYWKTKTRIHFFCVILYIQHLSNEQQKEVLRNQKLLA